MWYFKFTKENCVLDAYSRNIIIRKLITHTYSMMSYKFLISNNEFIDAFEFSKADISEMSEEEFNGIKEEVIKYLSEI